MTTADTVTYRLVAHDRPRQWHTVSREYFERIKAYVESRDKVIDWYVEVYRSR
jgi:hypothetical protein